MRRYTTGPGEPDTKTVHAVCDNKAVTTRARISYRDALVLLEGTDSKVPALLDKLVVAGIVGSMLFVGPGAAALLGPRAAVKQLLEEPLGKTAASLRGLRVADRTARIEAANCLLVVSAAFDVTETAVGKRWTALALTQTEAHSLLNFNDHTGDPLPLRQIGRFVSSTTFSSPPPLESITETIGRAEEFAKSYAKNVMQFIQGLQMWDELDETQRTSLEFYFKTDFPKDVGRKYAESFRRLASEVPELAIWASLRDSAATHSQLHHLHNSVESLKQSAIIETMHLNGFLATIVEQIEGMVEPTAKALAGHYASEVLRPILDQSDGYEGVHLNTLNSFVEPACKVATAGNTVVLSDESWWLDRQIEDSTQGFVASYLTNAEALVRPLILLGHPGAGKSVLTRVLVAQLDPKAFLPIRVILRDVAANGSVQEQVDQALYQTLQKDSTRWADLAARTRGALPVVILDGLDELIQATRSSRSNYIESIVEFQWLSKSLGNPVAVILTSRTLVMDLVRVPAGCTVIKLEPFNATRIEAWIVKWNRLSSTAINETRRPLHLADVIQYEDLAAQPLLLLMLALYDSEGNALADHDDEVVEASLYERLLTSFVRREVRKTSEELKDSQLNREIEQELFHLSIAGLAMFNRDSQVVTDVELDRDLKAILSESGEVSPGQSFAPALSRGQRLLGRFLFVNRSEARDRPIGSATGESASPDVQVTRSFEFLHATFGEYLVARFFTILIEGSRKELMPVHPWDQAQEVIDDYMLRTLFSMQAISKRRQIVRFMHEIFNLKGKPDAGTEITIRRLLRRSMWPIAIAEGLSGYSPKKVDTVTRHAQYSVNLVLAFAAWCGRVDVEELLDSHAVDFRPVWRRLVLLWESRLDPDAWRELVNLLEMRQNTPRHLTYRLRLDHNSCDDPSYQQPFQSFQDGWRELTVVSIQGPNGFSATIRENALRLGVYETLSGQFTEHLERVVGPAASAICGVDLTLRLDNGSGWSDGLFGSLLLGILAYPSGAGARDEIAGSLAFVLTTLGYPSRASLNEMRNELQMRGAAAEETRPRDLMFYVMRQVSLCLDDVDDLILLELMQATLTVGQIEGDPEYFGLVCKLSAAAAVARSSLRSELLAVATNAFARLDALHLFDVQPQFMLRLVIDIERSGLSVYAIAEEFGKLEDVLSRLNLIGLTSRDLEILVAFARERMLLEWIAPMALTYIRSVDSLELGRMPAEDRKFMLCSLVMSGLATNDSALEGEFGAVKACTLLETPGRAGSWVMQEVFAEASRILTLD